MSADDPDERTVEVLAVPPAVDEELLSLYFENRRRSGGGPLASSERRGDCVVLVFEEASGEWRCGTFCFGTCACRNTSFLSLFC